MHPNLSNTGKVLRSERRRPSVTATSTSGLVAPPKTGVSTDDSNRLGPDEWTWRRTLWGEFTGHVSKALDALQLKSRCGQVAMLHASRFKTIDRFSFLKQLPLQHRTSLGALLFVTVLTILSTPLFIALSAGTDPYGFFTIDTIAEPPMPVILTVIVNVAASLLSVAIYR